MLLSRLQGLLAGIYDLSLGDDVSDYVITDRALLPGSAPATVADEQLFVESGGSSPEVGVALYLDAAVLARLGDADPTAALHVGNVADYLTALEGVSHFVCVAWHASHGRDVSLLALEMQAEIDKYIATYALLRRQAPRRFPAELHDLLFARTRIDPVLAGERAALYRKASTHAARYCRTLERRLRRDGTAGDALPGALHAELMRFYRLPETRKLEAAAAG
jgi:hypothetical protein